MSTSSVRADRLLVSLHAAHSPDQSLLRLNLNRAPSALREPVQTARAAASFTELCLSRAAKVARQDQAVVPSQELDDMDKFLLLELARAPRLTGEELDRIWARFVAGKRY